MIDIVWDIETYPNCFTLAAEPVDSPLQWHFEISDYRDDTADLIEWCRWLKSINARMVGFNSLGFDYPVLHYLMKAGRLSARQLYDKAMSIIKAQDTDRWANQIYPSDRFIQQIDLFKINHYDNKNKTTSLKALEFAMRMENISDLPFPVGTTLNQDQIAVLRDYNKHDVYATKLFYHHNKEQIKLREELTASYGRDFMNANDTKIGADIFQIALEAAGIECYEYGPNGRQPRQTKREIIHLCECIPDFIHFNEPEFNRIKEWFKSLSIKETKGSVKDVVARVQGLDYVFGTGGMHASVENQSFIADDEWMILDIDVAGLYPSIAITRGYYPEHLGPEFVRIYKEKIVDERRKYAKGTAKNAAFKLGGNGVYGKSNDKFSIVYDPLFTMKITISGQMMIVMLAEWLLRVEGLKVIQCNTDGQTLWFRRKDKEQVEAICRQWEQLTGLTLEYVEYQRMIISDVNSYLAQKLDGSTKLKGRYDHVKETGGQKDWHKDMSSLVIPKVAEQVLIHGKPIRETLMNWPDRYDFFSRIKVPRGSRLVLIDEHGEHEMQSTVRYYVAKGGGQLVKIMPPLAKKPNEWRRIGVEAGWKVCVCNNVKDAVMEPDYEYYITEIEKLCLGMK